MCEACVFKFQLNKSLEYIFLSLFFAFSCGIIRHHSCSFTVKNVTFVVPVAILFFSPITVLVLVVFQMATAKILQCFIPLFHIFLH